MTLLLSVAEKVTGNLAELTGQVAPCDVSSIYGVRKAMGIAVPLEPPEPFVDLTTGKYCFSLEYIKICKNISGSLCAEFWM